MIFFKNLIVFPIVLLFFSNAIAAQMSLGEQSGNKFTYNKFEEYISLNLKDLHLPSIDDDSSKLALFFKKLFINRKRYGIAYIEVTPRFGKKEKNILFTYEKKDNNRYKYKYIGASSVISYSISQSFIYTDPIEIDIVIKEWEDEKASSAVKTIVNAAESSNLALGYENILSNITLMLDLVETLFPAGSTEEALNLKLNPDDIVKEDIQINGDESDFFKLSLRSNKAFFDDFDTEKGLKRSGIGDIQAWKHVISDANKNLSNDGLEPLIAVIQSYADYIATLPLNRKDQSILIACSINDWANDAVKGIITFEGRRIQFTAHDYSKLPIANLKNVRNTRCDFTGVNCNTSHCLAMSDFINKSSRSAARRIASELYIDGELTITFSDSELTLSPDEYVSLFRISRPAYFETELTSPNSWSYYFSEDSLDMRINGKRYKPYKIRIDLVRENSSGQVKYSIVGIEVESKQL